MKFKYRPLVEPDAIRLAHLHPAQGLSAQVECSLVHTTLSHYSQNLADQYTALSYVWGSATDTRTIIVDGCSVDVTVNLESALRHVRDKDGTLRIWVDAICINQDDVTERNHQVQHMGSVYSTALHMVIYLGPSDMEACSSFTELQHLSCHVRLFEQDLHPLYSKESLQKLHDTVETHVLNHPWFTRVWIFQELLMSHNPWVQCGNQRLKWDTFCVLLFMIQEKLSPAVVAGQVEFLEDPTGKIPDLGRADQDANLRPEKEAMSRLSAMQMARQKFQHFVKNSGPGNSLLDLLILRRGLGVSEASDMIYAHIGLASGVALSHADFKVDYSKTAPQVFTDVAQYFIEKYKDYRIFGHIEDTDPLKRCPGLPSWAPDWISNKLHNGNDKHDILSDLRDPVFSFATSKVGKRLLICLGESLGRISQVGNIIDDAIDIHLLNSAGSKRAWSAYLTASSCDELNWFPKVYDMLLRDWLRSMGIQAGEILQTPASTFLMEDAVVFIRRALLDAWGNKKNPALRLHPMALMSALIFYQNFRGLGFIEDRKIPFVESRKVCLTDADIESKSCWKGRIVLVPQSARKGDIICKPVGDSRAFVFRSVQGGELCDDGSEYFTVVGLCNISEGFQSWVSGGEKTFVLC